MTGGGNATRDWGQTGTQSRMETPAGRPTTTLARAVWAMAVGLLVAVIVVAPYLARIVRKRLHRRPSRVRHAHGLVEHPVTPI
jgi:hypothetical protein